MDPQPPRYRRRFLTSPHHVVLGVATLGIGFATGMLLPLIAGAAAYALGWIYLPDLRFFRGWVDKEKQGDADAAARAELDAFAKRRSALVASLSAKRRQRYAEVVDVCRDIEHASADGPFAAEDPSVDPRLRKLDELVWTFLRLLGVEESLERFLEIERRENLPQLVRDAEEEAARLAAEVAAAKADGDGSAESRERLAASCNERLEVLRKRFFRVRQARDNLALVVSEQDRLVQQVKLVRADAVATRNAQNLSVRIDATVEHLDETNRWLAQIDDFKDLAGDMPRTERRFGYEVDVAAEPGAAEPPPRTRRRTPETPP